MRPKHRDSRRNLEKATQIFRSYGCVISVAFLLDLMERQGGLPQIELAMSRTDIGDYLGLIIETVSRVFSKIPREGIHPTPGCMDGRDHEAGRAAQPVCLTLGISSGDARD